MVYRNSVNNISSHFTEPILKELAKDVFEMINEAQFIEEVGLNADSHNYLKKQQRGVSAYRYYKLVHRGLNLRLNTEVRNGMECLYMINIITK